MPIKKLRVSFDIDVDVLAAALAHGNSGMKIDVMGTDDPHAEMEVKRIGRVERGTATALVFERLKQTPDQGVPKKELSDIILGAGYHKSRVIKILMDLVDAKKIWRSAAGLYRLTKRGMAQ